MWKEKRRKKSKTIPSVTSEESKFLMSLIGVKKKKKKKKKQALIRKWLAAEAINDLHSGDAREIDNESNNLIGKKSSREGVVTRKYSKRLKGIHAVDNDVESMKPKTKKAKSVPAKASEKNVDEVVVSSTEKRGGELSNQRCKSNLLKQSSGGDEAEVLGCPKRRRRSARSISQDQDNEAPAFYTPVKSKASSKNVSPICMGDGWVS